MQLSIQNKLIFPLILLSFITASTFGWQWFRSQNRVYSLAIAAGSPQGEYYAFAKALAQVVARHQPKIQIEVLETEGSLENLELLSDERVQLALIQSDNILSPSTKAIASLFPEISHLIVAKESNIDSFSELKGKKIALMPPRSGSYQLFWSLSSHYGLTELDLEAVAYPPAKAHAALLERKVDALFRVIALGNPGVSQLLHHGQTDLVAIKQGAALQLFRPALFPSQIPQGTYNGAVPIPAKDLPVVAVEAVLVTREDIPHSIVYEITRILFEARNELVKQNIQAAMISQPSESSHLSLSFHEGAKTYYNQDRPSFLVEYAEFLGLLLSLIVLCISGIWQLKMWWQGRQKNRADLYNLEILQLIAQINSMEDLEQLILVRRHLFEILAKVIVDLDEDRVSPESFQSFTFTWKIAMKAASHQETILRN
ncbi:TAXI family TRAP transporter solute-binding subunit [Pleurocapsa sp. PCC 7319]|uniref:TAXI family TRAP transporter solute-binding subunit n=1 Tax=Pleurocapsa sp. PCC 7319 TaxID=118161 RepID=UPI0003496348|nr:TAXI family TRAP transporter solute-binding subunit [Pleurocapsa sp. PCC 7319]